MTLGTKKPFHSRVNSFDSLNGAKNSLESLSLEFEPISERPSSYSLMGSFAEFTAMKRLRITSAVLFDTRSANNPTSLRDVLLKNFLAYISAASREIYS